MQKNKRQFEAENAVAQLQGASQLVVAAVEGVANVVEATHRNISGIAPVIGASRQGPTKGITGFVYRRIRGVTRAVGVGLDAAFTQLAKVAPQSRRSRGRAAAIAAVNGMFGDYLAATANPLAIQMSFAIGNELVTPDPAGLPHRLVGSDNLTTGRIVVMLHGLCMSDLSWLANGHDHRRDLSNKLGATVLSLSYNTGRHISENGLLFAELMEQLAENWPVPVAEIIFVAHSMGGLVARSASAHAEANKMRWRKKLKSIVFMGTPHLGAPLERQADFMLRLLSASPYTAPLAGLGMARSNGIKDLRLGRIAQSQTAATGVVAHPAPKGVRCLLVAATGTAAAASSGRAPNRCSGDGLVPHRSALGLDVPDRNRVTFCEMNHFDLISSTAVCDKIVSWLQLGRARRACR